MVLRFISLALVVSTFCNGVVQSAPEDMHMPVVRNLNSIIEKQLNAAYAYNLMYMKHTAYITNDEETHKLLTDVIAYKNANVITLVKYAGMRGLTPNPSTLQAADLARCTDMAGCWEVSLDIERDLYKALQNLYSSASSHDDPDMQALAGKLARDEMRSIAHLKQILARSKRFTE